MNVVEGLPTECPNDSGHTITAAKTGVSENRSVTHFTSSSDPTTDENAAAGYEDLDRWKNTTSKDLFFLVHAETGKWVKLSSLGTFGGAQDIVVSWAKDSGQNYLKLDQSIYMGVSLPFRGTALLGTPTAIKVIVRAKDIGKYCDVRIINKDNADVIAEKLNIANNDFEIVDMGSLSSLPTGEVKMAVQGRKASTDGTDAHLQALIVAF